MSTDMSIVRFVHQIHSCYFLDIILPSCFLPFWVLLDRSRSTLCHLSGHGPSSVLIKRPVHFHFCLATYFTMSIILVILLIHLFRYLSCSLTFSIDVSIFIYVKTSISPSVLYSSSMSLLHKS